MSTVYDPIYGAMELLPCQIELLNTLHFQRLTRLQQLGVCSRVFPGATHTRAEHSLGVAWLARKMLQQIRLHQPNIEITEHDECLIVLAAQAHDLGHGIASHAFESWLRARAMEDANFLTLPEKKERTNLPASHGPLLRSAARAQRNQQQQTAKQISLKTWSHEEQSILILQNAIECGCMPSLLPVQEKDIQILASLIRGTLTCDGDTSGLPQSKRWMLEIVNNASCGIDVDRLDYLQRDAHHVFGSSGDRGLMNVDRIIAAARVTSDGQHIAYEIDLLDTLYHVFHRRWSMFRSVYLHNDVVGCELTLRSIMNALFESPLLACFKSSALTDIEQYLLLDDNIFSAASMLLQNSKSECAHLRRACAEWLNFQRDIGRYVCVAQVSISSLQYEANGDISSEKIATKIGIEEIGNELLLHCCAFHYGAGKSDPQSRIWFYKKPEPISNAASTALQSIDAFQLDSLHESAAQRVRLTPLDWQEWQIRVYCKSNSSAVRLAPKIQAALQKLVS